MKKLLLPVLLFQLAGVGCMFFPKEVKLYTVGAVLPKSSLLDGQKLRLVVQDARKDVRLLGSAGFADVSTKASMKSWVSRSMWKDLALAGCESRKGADVGVSFTINEVSSTLGFLRIFSKVKLNVEVTAGKKKFMDKTFSAEDSPFCFLNTSDEYSQSLGKALSAWKKKHLPAVIAAIEKAGRVEVVQRPVKAGKRRPPEIVIHEPKPGALVRRNEITLNVKIRNALSFKRLVLEINGKSRQVPLVSDAIEIKEPLKLRLGSNTIEIRGYLPDESKVSRKFSFRHAPYAPGNRRILAVGVSSFKNLISTINSQVDAADFADVLRKSMPEKSGKGVKVLAGAEVDFRSFHSAVKGCLSSTEKGMHSIIFYSGRSMLAKGEFVLAARDTMLKNPLTAFSLTDLALYLSMDFKGRDVLVIVNSTEKPDAAAALAVKAEVKRNPRISVLLVGCKTGVREMLSDKPDTNSDGHLTLAEFCAFIKKNAGTVLKFGDVKDGFLLR